MLHGLAALSPFHRRVNQPCSFLDSTQPMCGKLASGTTRL